MFKFFKKVNSDEYLLLFKNLEELRIKMESLKLEFDIVKVKLKAKRGIKDEPEEKQKDLYKGVLLPE